MQPFIGAASPLVVGLRDGGIEDIIECEKEELRAESRCHLSPELKVPPVRCECGNHSRLRYSGSRVVI